VIDVSLIRDGFAFLADAAAAVHMQAEREREKKREKKRELFVLRRLQ
jgi:hypothetical protein